MLNHLSKGTPFLYFEPTADGEEVFTIGNLVEQSGGTVMSGGMPGSNISTPYGNISTPGTPGSFGSYGNSFSRAKYFYTLLDPNNFDIAEGDATKKAFLSIKARDFVKREITNRAGGMFSTEPEYQLIQVPNRQEALLVSYLKKDGVIKLHRVTP